MTKRAEPAAGVERLFLVLLVPALIFWAATFYVRMTSDPDPLWTEFGTPLLFALLGARTILLPSATGSRNAHRFVGGLLIVLSVAILVLSIVNSQGAN